MQQMESLRASDASIIGIDWYSGRYKYDNRVELDDINYSSIIPL